MCVGSSFKFKNLCPFTENWKKRTEEGKNESTFGLQGLKSIRLDNYEFANLSVEKLIFWTYL